MHLRTLLKAVRSAKTEDERTIWNNVNTPATSHRREHLAEQKHGKSQEQVDHFKANESRRHALKMDISSILERFQVHGLHRNSQVANGWTEEKIVHLDSLPLEDKSYTATRKQRLRYENNWEGAGPMLGPMKKREDYPQNVTKVQTMRQQPSNPYIPLSRRFRQRPIEEKQKAKRQKWEWNAWESSPSWSSQASSSTE